jgi:hypothetical protein
MFKFRCFFARFAEFAEKEDLAKLYAKLQLDGGREYEERSRISSRIRLRLSSTVFCHSQTSDK